MLPYHTIYPEKRQQNDSQFLHYLSLGSYSTSFDLQNIISFSKITLTPKKYLPKLNHDDLKAKCESQGYKLHSLIIPLYGNFTIDQKHIANIFEQQMTSKEKENQTLNNFKINECNFVQDAEYIANKDEKDSNAVFLFILYKTKQSTENTPQKSTTHLQRFQKFAQTKSFNYHQILINSDVQFSFIQVLENTKLLLNPQDLMYLQKGKVTLQLEGQQSKVEIRNKGNKKGEQNYIDNMLYVSEQMKVEFEKGSLIFLVSAKKYQKMKKYLNAKSLTWYCNICERQIKIYCMQ